MIETTGIVVIVSVLLGPMVGAGLVELEQLVDVFDPERAKVFVQGLG
jgi:hypothetical protein